MAMARYITEVMKAEGYSNEIIAGIVGNVVNEGDFGRFEGCSSWKYMLHMMDFHNYEELTRNKYLYKIGMQIFDKLKIEEGCDIQLHKYGLGFVQWTGSRCDNLVERYKNRFLMTECPTKFQCQEVEISFMLEELAGEYKGVIEKCHGKIEELGANEVAVDNITYIIMDEYEQPGERNAEKRQEDARLWYKALTSSTYVVIGEN